MNGGDARLHVARAGHGLADTWRRSSRRLCVCPVLDDVANVLFHARRHPLVGLSVAFRWGTTSTADTTLSVLGTSSLFVYWIHVEMVYGLPS
jgi:hypothetical protein